MLRTIAGIIVGLLVTWFIVIAAFIITGLVLGWERTLQPSSFWTTNTFNMSVLAGGLIGAIAGGMVCSMIARNMLAAFALVAIMLATGIGGFVMNMNKPDPPARTGQATLQDVVAHGKEPTWFAISKTLIGAVGLLIGASLVKARREET